MLKLAFYIIAERRNKRRI